MILIHALAIERAVLDSLPIMQQFGVQRAATNLVSRTLDHFGLEGGNGLASVCAGADLDKGVAELAGVGEGVVEALAALVGHWVGGVADEGDETVVV